MDINDPQELGYVRFNALRGAMSMTDEVYDSLSDEEREEMRAQVKQFEQEPGFIGKLFGDEKSVKEMMFDPNKLEKMSEDEFYKLLDAAPAFQFNEAESYRGKGRLYMNPRTAVQNYQNGGPVGPPEDPQGDMFPEAIREGLGTLVEYAPKMAKFVNRGAGDLFRSDPVSPPELATEPPPADQLDFISEYSPVYAHNIPTIAGRIVEQLYDPEQTAVERRDLFMIPEKMGEAAPRISKQAVGQLLNDIKNKVDVENVRLDVRGMEAGVTPSPEIKKIFSQKMVVDRLVDFIRDETGVKDPDQLRRMVTETVLTTKSKMDPKGFAAGGVVSLKDRAVNMNRGPRTNGIMDYVPYITGATYGN